MRTMEYKRVKTGDCRYGVKARPIGNKHWQRIPGEILGASGSYAVLRGGEQTNCKRLSVAVDRLVAAEFGV